MKMPILAPYSCAATVVSFLFHFENVTFSFRFLTAGLHYGKFAQKFLFWRNFHSKRRLDAFLFKYGHTTSISQSKILSYWNTIIKCLHLLLCIYNYSWKWKTSVKNKEKAMYTLHTQCKLAFTSPIHTIFCVSYTIERNNSTEFE